MLNNPFSQSAIEAPAIPTQDSPANHGTAPTSGELPRPYKCPLCSKAFHRLEHQTRHIRTHTGEKPHACTFPGCSKRFSRSDELTRHARIHSNPNSRRNGRTTSQGISLSSLDVVGLSHDQNSQNNSPNVSPPNHSSGVPSQRSSGFPNDYELNALASAATQELERDKAHASHVSSFSLHPKHNGFSTTYHPAGYYAAGPYNRPNLTMSRQHSQEEEDMAHSSECHRSKRSRPGSPVYSTAPNSPLMHTRRSPTPDYTPLVTPAHSPRLHPREVDAAHGIHLPSIKELSLRGTPPSLAPLEVDPFQPGSGYNSPQNPRHHAPINASKLSDILESSGTDHRERTLPLPRVSIHDLVSTSPVGSSSGVSANISTFASTNRSNSNSAPHSRNNSHSNLRDLI